MARSDFRNLRLLGTGLSTILSSTVDLLATVQECDAREAS